ncbi:hypothetical protein HK104_009395 [Borealophlyctis nickersoniae]|nr:hypothetical protein HK104_009395 [Borealophlyctis nickersoniae]
MEATKEDDPIASFTSWLAAQNVSYPNVSIRQSKSGVSLEAAKHVPPNTTVLSIPRELLLGPHCAPTLPTFAKVYNYLCAHTHEKGGGSGPDGTDPDPQIVLVLLLLHIRSQPDATLWGPYVGILPKTFTNPLYLLAQYEENPEAVYDPTEVIVGSPLHASLAATLADLRAAYDAWIPDLVSTFGTAFVTPENASFVAFVWAHTAIESRAFGLRRDFIYGPAASSSSSNSDSAPLITCMVPLGDLANHAPSETATILSSTTLTPPSLLLTSPSTTPLLPGTPLLKTYNSLSNEQLLLHYGFSIPNNPLDCVTVDLEIPEEDEGGDYTLEVRKALLLNSCEEPDSDSESDSDASDAHSDTKNQTEEAQITLTGHSLTLNLSSPVPPSLIHTLRLLVATASDLEGITTTNIRTRLLTPLNPQNEQQVIKTVRNVAEGMLQAYPTGLEEDIERLKGMEDGWEKFAVMYLVGQKEILRAVVEWCETVARGE